MASKLGRNKAEVDEHEEVEVAVPASDCVGPSTAPHLSQPAAPIQSSAFEMVVVEKLDLILRKQKWMSKQLESVEARVSSLE